MGDQPAKFASTADYIGALADDRDNKGKPRNATSQIRRLLFAGEWCSAKECADRFSCSNGLLHMTIRDLEILGFKFDTQVEQGAEHGNAKRTLYKLRNPQHTVSDAKVRELRASRSPSRNHRKPKPEGDGAPDDVARDVLDGLPLAAPKRGRRPHKPPLPVLPEMGSTLTITMLSIDPDTGIARMGLRNGAHSYEVTVDAQR